MATKLSNMSWNHQVKGIPNDLFDGTPGHLTPDQPVEFGRIGYVTIWKKIHQKWVPHAVKCIMVGYSDDHIGHTYRMYDPMTNTVKNTRDINWAAWTQKDPAEAMKIFEEASGTTLTPGATTEDDLPMTMLLWEDEDAENTKVSDDKLGRNDAVPSTDNTNPTGAVTGNAGNGRNVITATPANAIVNVNMTASTTGSSMHPTSMGDAGNSQGAVVSVPRLMRELKVLKISWNLPADQEEEIPHTPDQEATVDLTFDHMTQLLCFTTELRGFLHKSVAKFISTVEKSILYYIGYIKK